jgi:hypothetical protein
MNTIPQDSLAQLQQRFQQQVLDGDARAASADISGHMEIYIQAYQGRMREALKSNFPVLHRALGDEAFGALAQAYCTAHPSRHRSLRWLGDGLLTWLEVQPSLLAHPALLDIARLDWAMRSAFDAANATTLQMHDLATMAAHAWPDLRLQTVPSAQCLVLQWGVQGLWHALQADEHAQTAEPEHSASTLLVWRQQLECRWRTLDTLESQALRLPLQGTSFAELCAHLQQAGCTNAAQAAAHYLQTWIAEGLLERTLPPG